MLFDIPSIIYKNHKLLYFRHLQKSVKLEQLVICAKVLQFSLTILYPGLSCCVLPTVSWVMLCKRNSTLDIHMLIKLPFNYRKPYLCCDHIAKPFWLSECMKILVAR